MVPLETIEFLPDPEPLPDETVTQHLELDRVLEALRHLAPDRAEALILRVLGEYSAAETAEIMGKSESAVKMLVYRAWGDLKRHLTPAVLQEGDAT
jgi:RNA polymerase sigma-70 factor (ECF subfamily)